MENFPSDLDLKNLVKELTQGRELTKQLQIHLNVPSSSNGTCNFLLYKILNSYEQALSMLKYSTRVAGGSGEAAAAAAGGIIVAMSDSPRSLTGSPPSDDSDHEFKDQGYKDQANSRKRKGVPRWTQKVEVSLGTGIEGQLDDGYGWRKYGQKDILGAKNPRGYYRCTHRYGKGCLATKQVQRSDDDPKIFEITYRGMHTCNQGANSTNNQPIPMVHPQNQEPISLHQIPPQSQHNPQEPLFNIQTSLRVLTQDLDTNNNYNNNNPSFDPFNFPSSSNINPENNHIFSDGNNDFLGNYSPDFMSPESNYFTILPNVMNNNYGGSIQNLHDSESELNRVVAATTCATNSPTLGVDFPFGNSSESGSKFSYGNPRYFP